MTNILVTGGAGFIGSNFVRYMVNKYPDYNIINLDSLTYCGNLENLKDIESRENYSFVKGDIRDKSVVDDLVKKCDYVINFAAESHVDRSISDPEIFIKSNVLGTQVDYKSILRNIRFTDKHYSLFKQLRALSVP